MLRGVPDITQLDVHHVQTMPPSTDKSASKHWQLKCSWLNGLLPWVPQVDACMVLWPYASSGLQNGLLSAISIVTFHTNHYIPSSHHHHGITSHRKIWEGRVPGWLQVHWWLRSPVGERQIWPQRLQVKVWSVLELHGSLSFSFLLFSSSLHFTTHHRTDDANNLLMVKANFVTNQWDL